MSVKTIHPQYKVCNTCCRPVREPFRVYDEQGNITHGCVAADHTGNLVSDTPDDKWHNRPEAAGIREKSRIYLQNLLKGQ